jgi:hypothetical protein
MANQLRRSASVARGQFSPINLLDMWARWDSGWYLDIALNGYALRGPIETTQSNVAFFPLYPLLIRTLLLLVPESWRTPEMAFYQSCCQRRVLCVVCALSVDLVAVQ